MIIKRGIVFAAKRLLELEHHVAALVGKACDDPHVDWAAVVGFTSADVKDEHGFGADVSSPERLHAALKGIGYKGKPCDLSYLVSRHWASQSRGWKLPLVDLVGLKRFFLGPSVDPVGGRAQTMGEAEQRRRVGEHAYEVALRKKKASRVRPVPVPTAFPTPRTPCPAPRVRVCGAASSFPSVPSVSPSADRGPAPLTFHPGVPQPAPQAQREAERAGRRGGVHRRRAGRGGRRLGARAHRLGHEPLRRHLRVR